jgi:ATP-dependent RNA helicase DDX24/MAK5
MAFVLTRGWVCVYACRIAFRGRPAIIDLTTAAKVAQGVTEAHLTVLEEDREACLYYLLAKHPGRTLVFVNAVSALRRVAALLKLLGLPAYALHAQQQQRQRLKVG